MKISTKNIKVLCLYKPKAVYTASERQYTATGEVQVPRGGIYEWRKAEPQEIDTRIGKANTVSAWALSLCGPKIKFSNTAKLSVFKLIFVPILTYGHESWAMTETILIQVQAPKMRFLRRVHHVTKGVPRLVCARGKKQLWRLHISTL